MEASTLAGANHQSAKRVSLEFIKRPPHAFPRSDTADVKESRDFAEFAWLTAFSIDANESSSIAAPNIGLRTALAQGTFWWTLLDAGSSHIGTKGPTTPYVASTG